MSAKDTTAAAATGSTDQGRHLQQLSSDTGTIVTRTVRRILIKVDENTVRCHPCFLSATWNNLEQAIKLILTEEKGFAVDSVIACTEVKLGFEPPSRPENAIPWISIHARPYLMGNDVGTMREYLRHRLAEEGFSDLPTFYFEPDAHITEPSLSGTRNENTSSNPASTAQMSSFHSGTAHIPTAPAPAGQAPRINTRTVLASALRSTPSAATKREDPATQHLVSAPAALGDLVQRPISLAAGEAQSQSGKCSKLCLPLNLLKLPIIDKSVKHLTCYSWKSHGSCRKRAEDCPYAHHDTGRYAEQPMPLISGRKLFVSSCSSNHL